ncbi:unnamed protein product, partial [Choristocarpus tenellus]
MGDIDAAAARIQAIQRGRLGRLACARRRRSNDNRERTARAKREQAAIKIQATCRGTTGRAKTTQLREQQFAAARIQAQVRGKKSRKEVGKCTAGGVPLDRADIKKGLHTLGRNPQNMQQCYVGLYVAGARLSSIDTIESFPLLQSVDLSGNHISCVKSLSRLPFLHNINVSHNCLSSVLDYHILEDEDFSWHADEQWLHDWMPEAIHSSSMLHNANLSFNSIGQINDLSHHKYLQVLDLSHNAIKVISGLSQLSCLRILRLNHNKITAIHGLDGLPLMELNLESNSLSRVENVSRAQLPSLRKLYLGHNTITNLAGLQDCPSLAILDIQYNEVSEVRQVEFLQSLPLLHTLILEGNPIDRLEAYRQRVLFRLQRLIILDRNKVPPEEKVKAINLMGEEDSDLQNRKQV